MSKPARNQLTLSPLPDGSWRLFGYVLGKKIRKQSRDAGKLLALKESLEGGAASIKGSPTLRHTWLTEAQVRDAEAAMLDAGGRSLRELVKAGARALGAGVEPMACAAALASWLRHLEAKLGRYPETLRKNKNRIEAFLRECPASEVAQITADDAERWILADGLTARTQLTRGAVLRAWLNYCIKKNWLSASPLKLDMAELAGRANPSERPRILTAAQCHALLEAARAHDEGSHLPFVVLSTWCFMRAAEVRRTRWADIHLDAAQARVDIDPRKRGTASYRVVTIPECARLELAAWKAAHKPADAALVKFATKPFLQVKQAAGFLEVVREQKRKAVPRVANSLWQPNILRHTGISYLYQKTGDIREVCRQAGNSSDTAFKHYLHLPKPGEAEEFYRVTASTKTAAE